MNSYLSGFASQIDAFVAFRKASNLWNEESYGKNIQYFDRFCAKNYSGMPLTQEMIDTWCRKRDTETNTSCDTRIMVVRAFVSYLQGRKMTDAVPPQRLKPDAKKYIPHAFSEDELQRFFSECDCVVSNRPEMKYRMKEIVCPAFFRLLYSSGIRTTEARLLERKDIDLSHGVINVRHSKGCDQHYIALHESMTSILLQYDAAAEKIRPNRFYFFESPMGKYYSRQWVTQTFKELWEKANGTGSNAVAYALRHHYAVTNINSWDEDIFSFGERLNSLSKSMGHKCAESTVYYYSMVPCLADILLDKTEAGLNEILPEVPCGKV